MAEVPGGSLKTVQQLYAENYILKNKHSFLGTQPIVPEKLSDHYLNLWLHARDLDPNTAFGDLPFARMAFSIEKFETSELKTVEELEKNFISTFSDTIKNDTELKYTIIRAASQVARATRRGLANVLLSNEKTGQDRLCNIPYGALSRFKIEVRDYIPDDVIYVIYKGHNEFDCGAIITPILYGDDLEEPIETFGWITPDASKYGVTIKL